MLWVRENFQFLARPSWVWPLLAQRISITMKNTILSTLTLAAALHASPALLAQGPLTPLDAIPRSLFRPALEAGEPEIHCMTSCRKTGWEEWGNIVCTRNKSNWTTWVVTLVFKPDGSWKYKHFEVPPGGVVWSVVRNLTPKWSWITHWHIVPPPLPPDCLAFEMTSMSLDTRGTYTADSAATIQAQHVPGLETASSWMNVMPTVDPPWSKSMNISPRGSSVQIDEDWDGQGDAEIDQDVHTHLQRDVGSLRFIQEIDRGKDGSIDHTACLNFWEDSSGTMHLELEAFDGTGALDSAFYASKTMSGNQSQMTTSYDTDGDGVTDQVEQQTTTYTGLSSNSVRNQDLDADGTIDATEVTDIAYRGANDVSLTITRMDGTGAQTYQYQDEMNPVAGGYFVEGLEDEDGDGIHDKRTGHLSLVSAFADGLDEDYLGIDADNDGSWDALCHTLAAKMLQTNTYVETVGTDGGADGSLEGVVVRTDDF